MSLAWQFADAGGRTTLLECPLSDLATGCFWPGGDIRVAGELPFAPPQRPSIHPLRSHVGDEIIQQDLVNFQRGSVTPFVVRLEAVYRDQTWSAFQ